MPAKAKAPKIKVEEVVDEPKVSEDSKKVQPSVPEKTVSEPLKVTSFSQLDSKVSEISSEKDSILVSEKSEEKEDTASSQTKSEELTEKPVEAADEKSSSGSTTDVKEWLKDIRPDTTKDVEKGGSNFNGKLFLGLLVVFILLGALAGGFFYYKQNVSLMITKEEVKIEPSNSPAPTETPTPEQKIDLSKLSVNILNGSGTAGQAGVVKDLLVTGGFSADKVKTGNASSYDFTKTKVQVKTDTVTSATDAVLKALEGKYTVEVSKENLPSSSSYDIVVTVGQKK
jgi:hypothetical protein